MKISPGDRYFNLGCFGYKHFFLLLLKFEQLLTIWTVSKFTFWLIIQFETSKVEPLIATLGL